MAQEKADTIKILGTVRHVSTTGSIIAHTYFNFTVEEVLEGALEEKTIIFAGDINSRVHTMLNQITIGKSTDEPIFLNTPVPVSKCFICTSKAISIKILRVEELLLDGNKLIQYFYVFD